jgi:hypothetical protein
MKLKKLKGLRNSVRCIKPSDRKYLKELVESGYVSVFIGSQGRFVGYIELLR